MRIDCKSPFPVAFDFLLLIVAKGGNSRASTISAALPFPRLFRPGRQRFRAAKRGAMNDLSRQHHWEKVYTTKAESEVSWFQETPALSLELIELVGAMQNSAIIDIGGGASRLVDHLVSRGYQDLTVLDLSAAALGSARSRIGDQADRVTWITADVTLWQPSRSYDVWHDRAAFHFLTEPNDQAAYVARLRRALRAGGHAIIATFAPDGPERCSGLMVSRYDADALAAKLGAGFELINTRRHEHTTPWGSVQKFQFSTFRRARDV
jgi:trans-aconitate methyltransferase